MIILREKNFSNGKIAILELSSGMVKLLIGPDHKVPFNFNNFTYDEDMTFTKNGISGGKMDLEYYKSKVLPSIYKFLDKAKDCNKIICTATAWARNITNLDKVQKLVPIKINVISANEEPKLSLLAFLNTVKIDLNKYDYLVSMDPGSMSCDIRVINLKTGKEEGISLNIPNRNEAVFKQELEVRLKRKFGWLKNEKNVLIAITGERTAERGTGFTDIKKQHGAPLNFDNLKWHLSIMGVINIIGEHYAVSNRADSYFGSYFKAIK